MRVDTSIASSTGQVLVFPVRDMEVSLRVPVFLRKAKIDDVDLVASLSDAHQEVVWLDITMDKRLCVDVLDA